MVRSDINEEYSVAAKTSVKKAFKAHQLNVKKADKDNLRMTADADAVAYQELAAQQRLEDSKLITLSENKSLSKPLKVLSA
jgi:hypothetical protein